MFRFLSRLDQVWILFAVVLFMAVPRTAFHHCEEGVSIFVAPGEPSVHADVHCFVCEVPLPIGEPAAAQAVHVAPCCFGSAPARPESPAILGLVAAPTNRGPPLIA